ncbi:unnamed protein product [Penicillium roqueforti FM164]|uniref:Uncharacterized protein n=1 Tax=Penicillium roqueforti (strain FM164) TaxID=1365484 RepID=W6R462_PENRF|nr:unnamed protein product [Penicillium roqueforti FM164]
MPSEDAKPWHDGWLVQRPSSWEHRQRLRHNLRLSRRRVYYHDAWRSPPCLQ